jgi:spermidine synthase
MKNRPLLPVFAATLFTSAFLIFAVQPMASKMLLPLLGGSPSVWNTAMVFFQAMLLAGYAYAHFVAKYLPLKMQAILHLALLIVFTCVLPLALPVDAQAPEESGQALWQLGVMLTSIGGPFFVLAASAPLFQHWFASSGHEDAENPYFLYAISNTGSMLALLGYPLLAEPLLTLTQQTHTWFYGYIVLIGLTAASAWLVRGGTKPIPPLNDGGDGAVIKPYSRLLWIALSFIPSSLMLGVTSLITTDIASAPFLWVLPLTIYLATFIAAFARKQLFDIVVTRNLTAYLIALSIFMFMLSSFVMLKAVMVGVHLLTFFFCGLLCHSELAKARPSTSHLTEYFLLISVGGVLGGIFNALIAPLIFLTPVEYPLVLGIVGIVIWIGSATIPAIKGKFNQLEDKARPKKLMAIDVLMIVLGLGLIAATYYIDNNRIQMFGAFAIFVFLLCTVLNRPAFTITAFVALLLFHSPLWSTGKKLMALDRNYFGVIKVYEQYGYNFLFHGTTLHGAQSRHEGYEKTPLTYYNPQSPAADLFRFLKERGGSQKVAALGLGIGSIACFTDRGRTFDFYEIDPDVVKVAENPEYFSFLSGCGSPYKIIMGDARMKIGQAPDRSYNLIFIDTFSSDNIPVHMMTKNAFKTYIKKLSGNGIIAVHISNRHLDLRGPLAAIAKDLGLTMYYKSVMPKKTPGDVSSVFTVSRYVVMAKDAKTIAPLMEKDAWTTYTMNKDQKVWTDDYANMLGTMFILQEYKD